MYFIIRKNSSKDIEEEVNKILEENDRVEILGGPSYDGDMYIQAILIK